MKTKDELVRLCAAYATVCPLPARYYDIEPKMSAIEGMAAKYSDDDAGQMRFDAALRNAIEEDAAELFYIAPKSAAVREASELLQTGRAAEVCTRAAELQCGNPRPWRNYCAGNYQMPDMGEVLDFLAWSCDHVEFFAAYTFAMNLPDATWADVMAAGTRNENNNENKDKEMKDLKEMFARYTALELSNGARPYDVPGGTTYRTEGNYAICEVRLPDYAANEDGSPYTGYVRMKYELNGPTHKMMCAHWQDGFRFEWSGASALKTFLESDGSDDELRKALTKSCAARFDKMLAGGDAAPIEEVEAVEEEAAANVATEPQPTPQPQPVPTAEVRPISVIWNGDRKKFGYMLLGRNAENNKLAFLNIDFDKQKTVNYIEVDAAKAEQVFAANGCTTHEIAEEWLADAVAAAFKGGKLQKELDQKGYTQDDASAEERKAAAEKAERERKEAEERKAAAEKAERERKEAEERKAAEEKAERERKEAEERKAAAEKEKKTEVDTSVFDKVRKCVVANQPVFLFGPAGTGKTTMAARVAESLGLKFYCQSSVDQPFELTGFVDANGHYIATEFFRAFTEGGVYLLDEIAACHPQVLTKINAAIANRYFDFPGHGRIEAHKDFRVMAADNTTGHGANDQYTGRNKMDAATLNRFVARIYVGYDERVEMAIAGGDRELVEFIHDLRNAVEKCSVDEVISYRQLSFMAAMKDVFTADELVNMAFIESLTYGGTQMDDARMLAAQLPTTSNRYTTAFRRAAVKSNKKQEVA